METRGVKALQLLEPQLVVSPLILKRCYEFSRQRVLAVPLPWALARTASVTAEKVSITPHVAFSYLIREWEKRRKHQPLCTKFPFFRSCWGFPEINATFPPKTVSAVHVKECIMSLTGFDDTKGILQIY